MGEARIMVFNPLRVMQLAWVTRFKRTMAKSAKFRLTTSFEYVGLSIIGQNPFSQPVTSCASAQQAGY